MSRFLVTLRTNTRLPSSSLALRRSLAVAAPPEEPRSNTPYEVFDRRAKRMQRDRAATREDGERSRVVDYIRREITDRVLERFEDVKQTPKKVLDLSSGPGLFAQGLDPEQVDEVELIELSEKTLYREPDSEFEVPTVRRTILDEEHFLDHIPENSQDAIVSVLGLHWVNDLPGVLRQCQRALKQDGFFLGAMFGGDTLFELRTSLQLAEQEREGGISPHISPMADPKDASSLLQRAGFTLLTVDIEDFVYGYPSMFELMEDLRDMGEGNAVLGRRTFLSRDTMIAAASIYESLHGTHDESQPGVPATFQVIFLMGWKPAPTQPQPLARGSGKINLKDVL